MCSFWLHQTAICKHVVLFFGPAGLGRSRFAIALAPHASERVGGPLSCKPLFKVMQQRKSVMTCLASQHARGRSAERREAPSSRTHPHTLGWGTRVCAPQSGGTMPNRLTVRLLAPWRLGLQVVLASLFVSIKKPKVGVKQLNKCWVGKSREAGW